MEKESIEFYKWDEQNAIIIKHNCKRPYSTIFFKEVVPFKQITDGGSCSSDFDIIEGSKYNLVTCPKVCKEYKIVVSKFEIKRLNIKDIKVLFDTISYIDNFKEEAKNSIIKAIHEYLNV